MQVERKTGLSSGEEELGGESRRGLLVGRNLKLDRVLFWSPPNKPTSNVQPHARCNDRHTAIVAKVESGRLVPMTLVLHTATFTLLYMILIVLGTKLAISPKKRKIKAQLGQKEDLNAS